MTPLVEQAEEYAEPLAEDLRRACEQVHARTGLQVRYDAGCQAQAWDGQWQAISPS